MHKIHRPCDYNLSIYSIEIKGIGKNSVTFACTRMYNTDRNEKKFSDLLRRKKTADTYLMCVLEGHGLLK